MLYEKPVAEMIFFENENIFTSVNSIFGDPSEALRDLGITDYESIRSFVCPEIEKNSEYIPEMGHGNQKVVRYGNYYFQNNGNSGSWKYIGLVN